jgi:hypothetical protein
VEKLKHPGKDGNILMLGLYSAFEPADQVTLRIVAEGVSMTGISAIDAAAFSTTGITCL